MNKNATHANHSGRSGSLGAIVLIVVGVIVFNAVATFALVGWRLISPAKAFTVFPLERALFCAR